MSEHENELKKALAEDGPYDAEKAENETNRARRWFDSRLKWSGRIAWMRIIVVVVVFEIALARFVVADSTKALVGYAATMIITIVLVGVIAVQSWVAGARIRLLREIKLLRLECLGRPTEQVALPDSGTFSVTDSTRWALSIRERIAWLLVLAVFAGAIAFATAWLSARQWPVSMAHFTGAPVTVESPRLGAPIYYTIYIRMNHGECKVFSITPEHEPLELFSMGEGFVSRGILPPGQSSLRLDPQGNKGEFSVRFE